MSQLLRRAVKNTTWSAVESAGSGASGLVISAFTISLLGLQGAGFAVAILALRSIAATTGGFGIGSAIIREVSIARSTDDSESLKACVGAALATAVLTGAAGALLLWVTSDMIITWAGYVGSRNDARWFCVLSGISFATQQLAAVYQTVLDGMQRYDIRSRILVSIILLQAIATVVVLRFVPSLVVLGLIGAVAALLRWGALAVACRRILGYTVKPGWKPGTMSRLWGYSRWLYLTALVGLLIAGGDRMVIVAGFGSVTLPFYAMSRRFYEMVHETLVGQMAYLLPMLSGSDQETARAASAALDDRLRWFVAALSGWFYTGVVTIGPVLLAVMISPEFAEGVRIPLTLLALVGLMHAQALVTFYAVQADGRPYLTFVYHLVCGVGVLPAMYLLGRWQGFHAAVAGQLWIGVCSLVFVWLFVPASQVSRFTTAFAPVGRVLLLFGAALAANGGWQAGLYGVWMLAAVGLVLLGVYFPILCRWEPTYTKRVDTLQRAVSILLERLGGLGHRLLPLGSFVFGTSVGKIG